MIGARREAAKRWAPVAAAVAFAVALAACGGSEGEPEAAPGSSTEQPTLAAPEPTVTAVPTALPTAVPTARPAPVSFAESIQPIVDSTCARCHTGDGPGTPTVRFDTAQHVADAAFDIATNVELLVMPPWPASDLSVSFVDDWSLSDEEIAAVVAWVEAGAPLDVEPDTAMGPAPGVQLTDHDVELAPEVGYDGSLDQPDEYRCLVYDPALGEDGFIEAFEFVPDQTEVVHHAIGYLIPGSQRDRVAALEAEDDQPGWSCFGGSRLGNDEIFLGWAPGQLPSRFGTGTGLRVGGGDFIVVQIHYHFDVEAPADRSALRLKWAEGDDVDEVLVAEYVAPAEIPCASDESGPLCDRDAAMERALARYGPDGVQADWILGVCGQRVEDFAAMTDGVAEGRCDLPVRDFGRIVSVLGHEHELGRTFRMTLNPDTPEERILLDIPQWDFDWQYNYIPAEEIVLEPGDWVRIECSWDRSLRDPELEPAYVFWADGTDDEMCFSTIVTRPV